MASGKKTAWIVTLTAAICLFVNCSTAETAKDPNTFLKAGPNDVRDWRAMKFGMTFSWGPYSLLAAEGGWAREGKRGLFDGKGPVPQQVYDNLYKSFYPAQFDANQWVSLAKEAGAKYVLFMTKHHDGFCMWDTNLTDYKITSSPFKRDAIKELTDACRKTDLKLGLYYSQPDWHHPDYKTENHKRYVNYLHGQLRELCSNYGRIDMMCFDGLVGKAPDWDAENMFKLIRQLQPHVIINDRAGLPADYQTPEQYIGRFQSDPPWESWITLGDVWAWKPEDNIKSPAQCIQALVQTVGSDGNFNLNVGPMPTGQIEPRQVKVLNLIGDWMKKYGQSIYSTRGGPFKSGAWGASTYKDNTIYVHILSWQDFPPTLPPISKKIILSEVLTGGTANVKQNEKGIIIDVPRQHQNDIDTIIKLQLDGPAGDIAPMIVPSRSLAAHKIVRASGEDSSHVPQNAVDDDFSTFWTAEKNTKKAWLEVDLGKDAAFDRVLIHEANSPWFQFVEKFELQYKKDGDWKNIFEGTKIGPDYTKQFDPVTARIVRLNISQAKNSPSIWEFELFEPKK